MMLVHPRAVGLGLVEVAQRLAVQILHQREQRRVPVARGQNQRVRRVQSQPSERPEPPRPGDQFIAPARAFTHNDRREQPVAGDGFGQFADRRLGKRLSRLMRVGIHLAQPHGRQLPRIPKPSRRRPVHAHHRASPPAPVVNRQYIRPTEGFARSTGISSARRTDAHLCRHSAHSGGALQTVENPSERSRGSKPSRIFNRASSEYGWSGTISAAENPVSRAKTGEKGTRQRACTPVHQLVKTFFDKLQRAYRRRASHMLANIADEMRQLLPRVAQLGMPGLFPLERHIA